MIPKCLWAVAVVAGCLGPLAGTAAADRIRIPGDDCRQLVAHVPGPDVAYRPGVDVRGKPVAPADLPGTGLQVRLPDQVEFDISFNPLRGAARRRFRGTELHVGRVNYDLKTGEVRFNGVPLCAPEKDELARRCREILRRR